MDSTSKYFGALLCLLFAFLLASCTRSDHGGSAEGPAAGAARRDSSQDSSRAQKAPRSAGTDVKQQEIARMQEALQQYQKIARQGGWPDLSADSTLEPGDSYGDLADLRKRLVMTGDLPRSDAEAQDSTYSGPLVDAVVHFQARTGLRVDSIIGPDTWSELNTPPQQRVGQLQASLHNLEELPDTLGTGRFILVNIPEFRLRAYRNGKPVLEMPVIVGEEYHEKQTPRFSDTMEYVIFRPYWNVPDGIAAREILPEAREDPGYLDRNG
ncbi:MAG TPA: L,D-transpeptidase family protein, partial [Rhodothermales bacterium]|nr:L,D-transpeptidase family protein [Rhodothermales bacterium]